MASLILIFTLLFTVYAIDGQALSYIEKNSVSLVQLDTKEVAGAVKLQGKTSKDTIKILVTKDKVQEWYEVNLENGQFDEEIWLTKGKGNYDIAIMVNEGDRKYSYGPKLTIDNIEEVNKFLVPTKHVESNNDKIINLANTIVKDKESDMEKARAIYDWVVGNIKYDYEKYNKHKNNNYDNKYGALTTLETRNGVCYDYATLTAALGRAVGLQTKVVNGTGITTGFEGFHAWNEIYITEQGQWIKIDTTFAATSKKEFFNNENFDESHIKAEEY